MTETRSQVIWRHAHNLVNRTSASWETYAAQVRESYEAAVPKALRVVEWSEQRDAHKRMRLDAQTLRRFEHDTRHGLPDDLEEAMVAGLKALGYSGHQQLLGELAQRYGLLAAPLPTATPVEDVDGIGRLLKETGEAIQAIAPILADGRIDENDASLAKQALVEINEAVAEMVSYAQRIAAILPDVPRPQGGAIKAVK